MNTQNPKRSIRKSYFITIISAIIGALFLIVVTGGFNQEDTTISKTLDEQKTPEINLDDSWPREVKVFNGTISITKKPQRILTASVGHDELTVSLVNLERLVGVAGITKDPTYSNVASLVKNIPEVDRDPENIVALNPDIIVTSQYFPEESIKRLNDLKITVVQTELAANIKDQITNILLLGYIYGEENRAEVLSAEINKRYEYIQSITADKSQEQKKKVASITRYSDQIWTAGSNSTEGMIIDAAGGINVASTSGIIGNATTSIEGLIRMEPEIIIITQPKEFGGSELRDDLMTSDVTKQIPAVMKNQIYFMETKHFTTLSFWNIRGIEELAKILWPDQVEEQTFGGFSLPK
ncbi:MAG: ABC transporter substrate-binding protein [Dehalococcoidia bacterium]